MVLLNAPPNGDASLRGNVFGVTGHVAVGLLRRVHATLPPRHGCRYLHGDDQSDSGRAVLPLAIANGDMFGHERAPAGRTRSILTFLTGVAAHGLLVFAQRTIQIGTIGIAQVAQPALAVVWSFLLLGERVRPWQVVGITIVMGGLWRSWC